MKKYTMQIFNTIMNHQDYKDIRKEVLIQFGFSEADPVRIVDWFEAHYPDDYEWIVSEIEENGLHNGIKEVVPSKVQLMSRQDRDNLLDVENEYTSETRTRYVQVNHSEWKEIGQSLKQQREELGLGITKLADMLGTSASRIRNFENGLPVQMSNHLEKCYKLALENYKNQISQQIQNGRKIVQVYEDELEQLIELKDDYRYQSEKWEHILHGFIGEGKLENVFFDWIDKQQRYIDSGKDDEFGITNELYGDLDELRGHFSYLLEEPTLLSKTMQEAKSKKNNDLLFQLLEQFRLYKIAKTDEQRQQARDKFHGNYTELYQRFNNKKISL